MSDLQILGSVDKRGQFVGPVASLGSVIENMVRDLTEPGFDCPEYTGIKVYTSKRASLGNVFEAMVRDLTEPGFDCSEYTGAKVYTSKRATDNAGLEAVHCTCDEDELTWDHTDCMLHGDGNGNIVYRF